MCSKLAVFLTPVVLVFGLVWANAGFAAEIDLRIVDGGDDAEQHLDNGKMEIGSSDLEMPYEDAGTCPQEDPGPNDPNRAPDPNDPNLAPDAGTPPTDEQVIGLRFVSIPVDKRAVITGAYVEFEVDSVSKEGCANAVNLIIEGELVPDAGAFADVANNITERTSVTKAKVKWSIPPWTAEDEKFQSPDISSIIQEIVNQKGWVNGNAIVLIFRDDKDDPSTGLREAESYDGEAEAAPLLHLAGEFRVIELASGPNPADGAVGVRYTPAADTYISADVPKAVPDYSASGGKNVLGQVTSTLDIEDSFTISDLNVELDITMSGNNADLDVYLKSPDGKQVELFTDVGLLQQNFTNTILDDEASGSITSGTGSFTGIYKPEGKLSDFDGRDPNGPWTLKLQDDWYGGRATLNSWRLIMEKPLVITWTPPAGAASQDVYFADNFEDVNSSAESAFLGNVAADISSIGIGPLAMGQTYFWRVNTLTAADELGLGNIWSFTTPDVSETAIQPSPADGAVDVAQDVILGWSPGLDAVAHDVYFGDSNSPAKLERTTGTSSTLPELSMSTTYYWRIDEIEADGTKHTGTVWSFTTVMGDATNPNPADKATGVALDAILSWTPGVTAATHDVYLGTTDPPEFIGNQGETSFDPNGLKASTTYYWRVDEVEADPNILHEGAVWSFTTVTGEAREPDPADGALIEQTSVTLSWTAGPTAASHDVYIGTAADALELLASQAETTLTVGLPESPIPDGLVPGTTYYWRVDEVEVDPNIVYEGAVWSFAVPPLTAYNPSPADGATEVATDGVIGWTPGLGAVLHAVYFGRDFATVSTASGATPLPETSFNVGPLDPGEIYYWRVDEVGADPSIVQEGAVWSFTTAEAPPPPAE